jgi:hypothetical protein
MSKLVASPGPSSHESQHEAQSRRSFLGWLTYGTAAAHEKFFNEQGAPIMKVKTQVKAGGNSWQV